jgi:translation initiation factor 1
MSEVCPKCGLNKELCICETLAKKDQIITVKLVKRKFGKLITLVEGFDKKDIDIRDIAKKLKSKFACGGTNKGGIIELQGDHLRKVKEELANMGFDVDTITVHKK